MNTKTQMARRNVLLALVTGLLIISILLFIWQKNEYQKDVIRQYILDHSSTSHQLSQALSDFEKNKDQEILANQLEWIRFYHYPHMSRTYGNEKYIGKYVPFLSNYHDSLQSVDQVLVDAMNSAHHGSLTEKQIRSLQETRKFLQAFDQAVARKDFSSVSLSELKDRLDKFYATYPKE
ncbi:hypothetical protein [Peribacillus acanthi]|uniref:hypothetical protein n=1 Tax=Peribacillus acanthi TaxID=2171554 RepID=UPI0013008E08|nr:hypothetical protein [Peribacillus acanthi]